MQSVERLPWGFYIQREGGHLAMNGRTNADKAWEARQEAARYRIFNAAASAAEATSAADIDDETYFTVWQKRATPLKPPPANPLIS
jgi:hypothetical protein